MAKKTKKKSPPPIEPVIELTGLTKRFGQDDTTITAIDTIDLKIEKGEFVAIMGPSGCGKTTLLNILGLLDTPSEGEYGLDGRHVAELSHREHARLRSRQIGFVFQSFNLISRMSVIENVALPLIYHGGPHHRNLVIASKMLRTFELGEREYYMPNQLSGGQLQRVAIARALVNKPSIILADEPTGNLDSKSSDLIMSELRDIHQRGNTIIMVTHNPDLTVYATRIIHMKDGRIASDSAKTTPHRKSPAKRSINMKKVLESAGTN
jgi:putative ABC transport system ATP-binding protein